jgi:hypothetical protein
MPQVPLCEILETSCETLLRKGSPMGEQRRSSARRRVLKAGLIAFEGSSLDCMVRNVSAGGVSIEILGAVEIPEEFKPVIEADDFIRACRVAWRRGPRLGLSFA